MNFFRFFGTDLRLIKNKTKIEKFRKIPDLKHMEKKGVIENLQSSLRIATKKN